MIRRVGVRPHSADKVGITPIGSRMERLPKEETASGKRRPNSTPLPKMTPFASEVAEEVAEEVEEDMQDGSDMVFLTGMESPYAVAAESEGDRLRRELREHLSSLVDKKDRHGQPLVKFDNDFIANVKAKGTSNASKRETKKKSSRHRASLSDSSSAKDSPRGSTQSPQLLQRRKSSKHKSSSATSERTPKTKSSKSKRGSRIKSKRDMPPPHPTNSRQKERTHERTNGQISAVAEREKKIKITKSKKIENWIKSASGTERGCSLCQGSKNQFENSTR